MSSPVVADIDGDGKMDVVAGPYWIEGPDFTKMHPYTEEKAHDPNGYSKNFFAFAYDFKNNVIPGGTERRSNQWPISRNEQSPTPSHPTNIRR